MLGGAQGQDAVQMLDIMGSRIVPLLRLPAIQALCQTCTVLRNLIENDLSQAAWAKSIALTVPPGHSLITSPPLPNQMVQHLSSQADLYHAISNGRLANVSELTITPTQDWPGSKVSSVAASRSGELIVTKTNGTLVLSKLSHEDTHKTLRAEDLWQTHAPPPPQPWGRVDCELVWSDSDEMVALKYTPFNGVSDDAVLNEMTLNDEAAWNVLYVLDTTTRQVREVCRTPPYTQWHRVMMLGTVIFSPNSRLLACPWSAGSDGGDEFVQVIEHSASSGGWSVMTKLTFEQGVAGHCMCFSPDSVFLAFTRVTECVVYCVDGTMKAGLEVKVIDAGSPQYMAWSPSGSHLACWCSDPPAITVFETEHWTQVAVTDILVGDHYTHGLLYGLRDLIHVSAADDQTEMDRITFCRLASIPAAEAGDSEDRVQPLSVSSQVALPFFLMRSSTDLFANMQPVFQETLPALSPNGSFLAVVDRAFCLHVVKCATREVVLEHQLDMPASGLASHERTESVAQLRWVRSGKALLVNAAVESETPPLCSHITLLQF